MHLFHDSTLNTWRLITENLPARPDAATASIRSQIDYAAAIAALKQNALTVGNPEILDSIELPFPDNRIVRLRKSDEWFEWPGSYSIWVNGIAILTLPEEKKNTMGNNAHGFCETPNSKCTMSYCDENGCIDRKRHLTVDELAAPPTASRSVAAPKEEHDELEQALIYIDTLHEVLEEILPLAAKSPSMSTEEFLKIVDRAKALLDKQ